MLRLSAAPEMKHTQVTQNWTKLLEVSALHGVEGHARS